MTKTRLVAVGLAASLWGCGSKSAGQSAGPDAASADAGPTDHGGPPSDLTVPPTSTTDGAVAHPPGACADLGAVGVWESVTPPAVHLDAKFPTPAGTNFGAHSFVINPADSSIIYLGTSAQGIYKTTDCGATWTHINTGRNGASLDKGRQWTFVIDPVDPNILYTNSGYGVGPEGSIAWKSINGGVDWDPFITGGYTAALQFGNFVHLITLDPTDHQHLIVTPHFECEVGKVNGLPKTPRCLLETKDAGATWRILEGTPVAGEGSGPWIADSKTWFWSAYFGGLYRTTDGGASWAQVYKGGYADPGGFTPGGGTWFTGAEFNVLTSSDGGATWSLIKDSPGANTVTGDSSTLFISRSGSYNFALASDPTKWTKLPSPVFPYPDNLSTWKLQYDADRHLLYSLNGVNGFWRMRTQ